MTLNVLDQFPFEFYDEHFFVALANDRQLYIPMAAVCQAMDLQTHGQTERLRQNEAVADAVVSLPVMWAYGEETVREREMVCLRLDKLPFWMGTLQPNRIQDPEKRQRIITFQRDLADVAWAAFRREIMPDDMLAEMDAARPAGEQEYLRLMDEAAELRQQLATHDTSLETHESELDELKERISTLEAKLLGTDFINAAQANEYMDMVGIVARQLKRKRKGNEGTVHAEVKRQFKVPSYMLIPEDQFDDVKAYLRQWYVRLAGPGVPVPAIFENPSQKRLL